jgi:hypothetical protein
MVWGLFLDSIFIMNQPNLRKFRANIGDFKFFCTIEHAEFYLFDKVAHNLAKQYSKKLFGRHGNVASLREGRHSRSPQRYWNYEGYVGKFDKFGIFLEGRCIDFNFTEVAAPVMTETHIQKRLRLLHQQVNLEYSIPELRHQTLQTRVLARADYYGVCPIPAKSVTLADVLPRMTVRTFGKAEFS